MSEEARQMTLQPGCVRGFEQDRGVMLFSMMDGGKDDLRLLAGDRLYALGLSRLVALGDVPAVSELADLITISARAQESGERELAEAAWMAGARAIGWGASEEHQRAKELAFAGSPETLVALRSSAGAAANTRP